jgi:predicted GIY-YIG superfamily endonuclease
MPIAIWCESSLNTKIAGVYAVLNEKHNTQYIGYSRNVLLSLNSHIAQLGKSTCALVRVQSFKYPKRTEMENLRDAWLAELDSIPPGNDTQTGLWTSTVEKRHG